MIRTVNVKGESMVKGGKCTMEKMSPRPRTVTANFMKLHNISTGHAIELMGNYYSHDNAAVTWEPTAEEESVELVNLDF